MSESSDIDFFHFTTPSSFFLFLLLFLLLFLIRTMRLASLPHCSSSSSGSSLRVSEVTRHSPRCLHARRAATAVATSPSKEKKKNHRQRPSFHAARRPIVAASASSASPSPSSSASRNYASSSSGDDDETCDVYVTPDGEVVEVRHSSREEKQKGRRSTIRFLLAQGNTRSLLDLDLLLRRRPFFLVFYLNLLSTKNFEIKNR